MNVKRTAILVDGANNYAACKQLKFSMDYDKLLGLDRWGEVVRPCYFTALPPKTEYSDLRKMVDHLEFHGWTVIQKPTKEWTNEEGGRKIKGNMDIELALAAIDIHSYVTDIALFTGDGDFRSLVEWLQRKAIRVTAYSTLGDTGQSPMIADELRRQVDCFVDLKDLKYALVRGTEEPVRVLEPKRTFLRRQA